jgi:hypothetical protein
MKILLQTACGHSRLFVYECDRGRFHFMNVTTKVTLCLFLISALKDYKRHGDEAPHILNPCSSWSGQHYLCAFSPSTHWMENRWTLLTV